MHMTRLSLLIAIPLLLGAAGCIERLPPLPPPEAPPYPQEKFDSPLNAWHQYQRAGELLARAGESVQFPPAAPGDPWWAPQVAEYLKQREAALEALGRGVAAPYCVGRHYGFGEPMPEMARMRELARLRVLEGRLLARQGDTAGAVGAWLDTIELGHDVMQEGALVARLVGIAIDGMGSGRLAALVNRLAELDRSRFPFAGTLGREYADSRPWLERAVADPSDLFAVVGGDEGKSSIDRIREYLAVITQADAILSNYDTYWAMCIADARRPYAQRDRALKRVEDKLASDPLMSTLFPMVSRLRVRGASDVVSLRAVAVMAALQLYRLDNDRLPATLDALRPTYLAELPLDPFSGQPFRYLREPDGRFVIYSIGPDGDDDRAEVEWEWGEDQPSDGDIIFREGEGEP
jgi:hypothetical protein